MSIETETVQVVEEKKAHEELLDREDGIREKLDEHGGNGQRIDIPK